MPAPDGPEVLFNQAQELRMSNKLELAAESFERSCALRPGLLAPYLEWAETLLRQGRLEGMRDVLTRGLKSCPLTEASSIDDRLVHYRAAAVSGRFEEAQRLGERVLDASRALPHLEALAWPVLIDGYSMDDMPPEYLTAQDEALDRFVEAQPRSPWGRYLRLYLTERMVARHPSAVADGAFLRELDAKRYGWMRYEAGTYCLHTGDSARALEDFSAAEACSTPRNWRAQCRIADVLITLGDFTGAKTALRRAEETAGPEKKSAVLAHKAGVMLAIGDFSAALTAVTDAVAQGAWRFPHYYRGAALLKLGRAGEALEALDVALLKEPENSVAGLWRGEALLRLGRPAEAAAQAERVLQEHADSFYARILRGLAEHALGIKGAAGRALGEVPAKVRLFAESGAPETSDPDPEEKARRALERILELSRGARKAGHMSSVWMRES